MAHRFLPTLERDEIPATTRDAFWKNENLSLIRSAEKCIAVDGTAASRGISAVPDVWARAVLFQAMLQPMHPLHAQAVQEWRGLLSLLALRTVLRYDVALVPVDLREQGNGHAGTPLVRALARLAPSAIDLEQGTPYAWTDALLITYAGKPIGALSPGSLVFPAIGYERHFRGARDTVKELLDASGRLQPPTNPETLLMLAEWVDGLVTALNPLLGTAGPAQHLGTLLREWRADLLRTLGIPESDPIDAPEVKRPANPVGITAQSWSPLSRYKVYQHLLSSLVEDDNGDWRRKSTIFLQFDRPAPLRTLGAQPLVGAIVIHEDTLTDAVKIWGPIRRSSLGEDVRAILQAHFKDASGTAIGGQDLSRQGVMWIRPEKFFLTDVLLGPQEGPHHVTAPDERASNGGGEYLLPFRKEILEFYTPEEIVKVLRPRFEEISPNEVLFSFMLPIGAPGSSSTDLTGDAATARAAQARTFVQVNRRYRVVREGESLGDDGLLTRSDLPIIDLFPRYLGKTWRRYYLASSDPDHVAVLPFAPKAQQASRRRTRLLNGKEETAQITELFGDDPFPDGLAIVSARSAKSLGLLLTPRDTFDEAGLRDTVTVGIDFGTSNTNVYGKVNTSPTEAWKMDFPAFLRPFTVFSRPKGESTAPLAAHEIRRNAFLRAFLVPNETVEFPISTLLDVTIDDTGRALGKGRMLLDYGLVFPDTYALWPSTWRDNLKWEKDQRRVTKEFLESLLFLLLLRITKERYHTVHLRCTYPKSFSAAEKKTLQMEYGQVFDRTIDVGDHALLPSDRDGRPDLHKPVFLNEGFSAAKYFSSDDVDARYRAERQRAVGVDVGGGTSDIALIYRDDIVYDTSVRLAGRQIALYVQKRPRLQELLFSKEAVAALREAGTNHERFGALFNLVLRREDRDIRTRLVDYGQGSDVLPLRHLIALQFGAIAFHVGAILAAAARSGLAPELAAELAERGISLHWGGNASRLLGWVDMGEYSPGGMAAGLLNGLLHLSLRDYGYPNRLPGLVQVLSHAPKAEAAGGVVVSNIVESSQPADGALGGIAPTSTATSMNLDDLALDLPEGAAEVVTSMGVVCGETVALTDGTTLGPLDEITPSQLFTATSTRLKSISGERFVRFVQLFNAVGERAGLLNASTRMPADEGTRLHVTGRAKDDYVEMQGRPEGERYVEPVFIAEARHLIELVVAQRG